jgi:2-methylaconitate isomerase
MATTRFGTRHREYTGRFLKFSVEIAVETRASWEESVIQRSLRAAFYRGGTSKAVIFRKEDLPAGEPPANCAEWDRLFLSLMGSPDPAGRQLDGMGGGISSLSKIAIVSPSTREGIDVDYTFAQIGIDKPVVSYRGNCGNIGSAIGPYALDEGIVSTNSEMARVRIFNTNTGKRMVAQFATEGGNARVEGDFSIDGVSRPGSPIRLTFLDPGGAATGKLLPTGNVLDILDIGGGRRIEASLVDVANPVVMVDMDDVCPEKEGFDPAWFQSPEQRALFEDIRVAAAQAMGLVPDEETARTRLTNLPLVCIVRRPCAYVTSSANHVDPHQVDIVTQMVSMGLPHKATPLTGAMCLAAASRIEGTVAHAVANPASRDRDEFRIGHPSGVLQVTANCKRNGDGWHVGEAGVFRTARRLFDGRVWMPDDNIA